MKLETEDGTEITNPDHETLRKELARVGLPGNGFAILSQSEQCYVQTTGSRADGFVIEYRDGSEEQHFSSTETDIAHERMVALFEAYRSGGAWQSMTLWDTGLSGHAPAKPERQSGRSGSRDMRLTLRIFGIVGICLLGVAGAVGWNTHSFIERAVEVPGKVVDMHDDGEVLFPIVEYADPRGDKQVFRSSAGSSPPSFHVGEQVSVLYVPNSSDSPRIRSLFQLWGTELIVSILGTVFTILGVIGLLTGRRKRGTD
ncbi:MAG: DUF3592 domain-containing protein [Rhodocyclaceae bacterium]